MRRSILHKGGKKPNLKTLLIGYKVLFRKSPRLGEVCLGRMYFRYLFMISLIMDFQVLIIVGHPHVIKNGHVRLDIELRPNRLRRFTDASVGKTSSVLLMAPAATSSMLVSAGAMTESSVIL
jgi:hypothetical protein